MTGRNITLHYGMIMAVYSVGFVIMSAFSSVFLLNAGLSSSWIGVLLALGGIISALLQPVAGALIDHHPTVSAKTIILLCSTGIFIFGILLILTPGRSLWLTGILYGVPITLLYLAQPILNTLGMEALNLGYNLNFGVCKALGSFGYAAGSYVFGIISVMLGATIIPLSFTCVYFILCLIVFFYPVRKTDNRRAKSGRQSFGNPYLFLARYKRFAVVLVGLTFIYFSHTLINTYSLQILLPKGGTSADMGTAAAIAAVCELITMLLFFFYMKKIRLSLLLKISGVFFTLKILFSLIVRTVAGFFVIQGFQMFGWGILAIGIVYYVNDLTEKGDKAQGQAYAGVAMTAGNILASFLGGYLIDSFGVDKMLMTGTVISAAGTLILWIFTDDRSHISDL
ncbi:MAG: MFS transporter [Lachnospiraceae bacterium]|nr:MFS transporter [Lachnospiraceae bacterium]